MQDAVLVINGKEFRHFSKTADKNYHTCTTCDGDGTMKTTVYTTKTKELPWGYFSGIEVKRISTTSKTFEQLCETCAGKGVILK